MAIAGGFGKCVSLFFYVYWSVLVHPIIAQDLIGFSGNSSRVIGYGVFSRVCRYQESDPVDHMEWLRNGVMFERGVMGESEIFLTIREPGAEAAGQYSCFVQLTTGVTRNASAGFLIIYNEQFINAPGTQQAVAGTDIELQCSSEIPDTSTTWRGPGDNLLSSGIVRQVYLEHGGQYECSIIVLSEGGNEIYAASIQLQVVVPPRIIDKSPVEEETTYTNEPATLTVNFLSSYEDDTTVSWLLNNTPFSNPDVTISTQYANESAASTSLEFLRLTRSSKGTYTANIDNSMTLIPTERRNVWTSFIVKVVVPPTRPSAPVFEILNSTLSRIAWNLSNMTAVAGPHTVIVNIHGHPKFPVINVAPSQKQVFIETEPGVTYNVTISAINVDGIATSAPALLTLPAEPPLLSSTAVLRVNQTVFNFTLEVVYTGTGGGSLMLVNIMFREADTLTWNQQHQSSINLTNSGRTWYALVTNELFAMIRDVEFSFTVQNAMEYGVRNEIRHVLGSSPTIIIIAVSVVSVVLVGAVIVLFLVVAWCLVKHSAARRGKATIPPLEPVYDEVDPVYAEVHAKGNIETETNAAYGHIKPA